MYDAQSYERQIQVLENLKSDIDALIRQLDTFADIYNDKIIEVDNKGIMKNITNKIRNEGLPKYNNAVSESIDELNRMKQSMDEFIADLEELKADAENMEM